MSGRRNGLKPNPLFQGKACWVGSGLERLSVPWENKMLFVKTESKEQPHFLLQVFLLSTPLALPSHVSHPAQCVWSHMMVTLLQQLQSVELQKRMKNL